MITLSCRPSDDLNWHFQVPTSKTFWRLDLGLESPDFHGDDLMHFRALSLALQKFSQDIWPKYQEQIEGVILYSGSIDWSLAFSWTDRQKENWNLWKMEQPPGDEVHLQRLFCADVLAHSIQMLSSSLPDELPIYLLFDAEGVGTLPERHHLLSTRRFEHFEVAVLGLSTWDGRLWDGGTEVRPLSQTATALCFPEEKLCSKSVLSRLDRIMAQMPMPFRVISETFLTEKWEGVDTLYVLSDLLSAQGERKIAGFQAAGGVVRRI